MIPEEIERRIAKARTWAELAQLATECRAADQAKLTDLSAELLAARFLEVLQGLRELITNAKAP